MQIRGNYLRRVISSILMFALTVSIMVGCGTKKAAEQVVESGDVVGSVQREVKTLPLDTVLITVDEKEYTLADLMYIIYSQEEYFNKLAIQYTETDNIDFWNDILDENTNETGRDMALESTVEMIKMLIFAKQQAEESGYELSSDVQQDVEFYVEDVLNHIDEEHQERTGFTKENLTTLVTEYLVAKSYCQDQIEAMSVDEKKIEDSLDYEDYRQRQIESVFVQTVTEDAAGNTVEQPVETVAELVKKANQILSKVKEGEEMEAAYASVVTEEDTDITYTNLSYSDEDLDEAVVKALDSLEDGQCYEKLVETEGGYYIVRLINGRSTELYDDEVQYQISMEKQSLYDEKLSELYEKHSIIVNEEAFSELVLGNYAYTPTEEAEIDDSEFFETNDSNSQEPIILPEDAANGDDGSVG